MTLTSKKITRPTIRTPKEDAGPVGFARMFADEYKSMEDGHQAQLRAFLGRAY